MTSAPAPPANGMAAAQPPALFPAKLPLLRPKHGRWIAGVARGIGMHLGVHVAWVRLAFALSCFAYGAGAIAYVALWVLVPPGDPVAEAARRVRLAQSAGAANAPLSRGNTPYGTPRSPEPVPDNPYDYTGLNEEAGGRPVSMESMRQVIDEASKPALFACAGVVLIAIALLINQLQTANGLMLPVLLAATGVGLPWLRFNARRVCVARRRIVRARAAARLPDAHLGPRARAQGTRRGARRHGGASA